MKAEIEKCNCGYPKCDYHGLSIGHFPQGTGFDKETAELLARLWNVYHEGPNGAMINAGRGAMPVEMETRLENGILHNELCPLHRCVQPQSIWKAMMDHVKD